MGEAKRRGSFEQRKSQSIANTLDQNEKSLLEAERTRRIILIDCNNELRAPLEKLLLKHDTDL